jgi:hypothetical protein
VERDDGGDRKRGGASQGGIGCEVCKTRVGCGVRLIAGGGTCTFLRQSA